MNMPKLKLYFFLNTGSVFLFKVFTFRACKHEKEPEFQLELEIRKSPSQTAFKMKSGQADRLCKQISYHQNPYLHFKGFSRLADPHRFV